jgi:hypothetical protein
MKYKVYDEEDKKERTIVDCRTTLEVGTTKRVTIQKGTKRETHHFRILEKLPEQN